MTRTPMDTHVEEMARQRLNGEPDYDSMWNRIEKRLADQNETGQSSGRRIARHKKKVIVAAASVYVLAALPVMAAVNGGWDSLWNGRSSTIAIEQGYGNRLDLTVTSGGIPFTLNGVATDDQRMNMLLTMNLPGVPEYDAIEFRTSELSEGSGGMEPVQVQLHYNADQDRLYGLASVQNTLGEEKKSYRLSLEDLVFYQYRNFPLDLIPADSQGKVAALSGLPVDSVKITSVIRQGNIFTVQYRLAGAENEDTWRADPQLVLTSGGEVIPSKSAAIYPSEDPNVIERQITYEIADSDLEQSRFAFSVLEESGKKEGSWSFDFEADGKKAAQGVYATKLNPADAANDSVMKFTELVITPLEVRLMYEDKSHFPKVDTPSIYYNSVKLVLDDQEVDSGTGYYHMTEDGRAYRRFEFPNWYEKKNWGNVPMKVILSGKKAVMRAEDDHLLTLTQPAADIKTLQTELNGAVVEFTYRKEGRDLIVESSSDNSSFGGIGQSYLLVNGERKIAEMKPTPPGGNGTNRKVERFVNVPEGDLELNPFWYSWLDPAASVELTIR